jgi:hypothetical protein
MAAYIAENADPLQSAILVCWSFCWTTEIRIGNRKWPFQIAGSYCMGSAGSLDFKGVMYQNDPSDYFFPPIDTDLASDRCLTGYVLLYGCPLPLLGLCVVMSQSPIWAMFTDSG